MLFVAPLNVPDRARLVDERGHLCEEGKLLLLELPTNFLVVGCVGLEGSGKSTIMSTLFHGSGSWYLLHSSLILAQVVHRAMCSRQSTVPSPILIRRLWIWQ